MECQVERSQAFNGFTLSVLPWNFLLALAPSIAMGCGFALILKPVHISWSKPDGRVRLLPWRVFFDFLVDVSQRVG